MPAKPTKLQRWLDLVACLAARRLPVSTEDLWRNVPAYSPGLEGSDTEKARVRRTFERDKDELRELGIPIETVQYTISYGREEVSGYRLARSDFHLPYLKLLDAAREGEGTMERDRASARPPSGAQPAHRPPGTPSVHPSSGAPWVFGISPAEAGAALDGLKALASIPSFPLARAARGAFRKLAFDLDPDAFGESPVVYAEDPESAAARDTLHALSDAVQRRKEVGFVYHAISRDAEEERMVRGYGLLFQHGRWYLVGHDLDRDAVRMYRVGRIRDVEPNPRSPGTPDYDVPPDFSLDDYAGRSAWELGGDDEPPREATVRFRFPRSLWADRNDHGELVEEDDDGGQLRRFAVHRADPFLRWVLSLAGDARVEDPPELRDAFHAMAARVADLHAPRSG